ncbi:MAG: hypothetical protein WBM28_05875, partial [Burkholderiales bacterium]
KFFKLVGIKNDAVRNSRISSLINESPLSKNGLAPNPSFNSHPTGTGRFYGDQESVTEMIIVPKQSPLKLIWKAEEFLSVAELRGLPAGMRGIYVLYKYRPKLDRYDVVYVGMASSGSIRVRVNSHRKKKANLFTHCSIFQVWDNITEAEVEELEGLFRHFYRFDSRASALNRQRSYRKLKQIPQIVAGRRRRWKPPFPNTAALPNNQRSKRRAAEAGR